VGTLKRWAAAVRRAAAAGGAGGTPDGKPGGARGEPPAAGREPAGVEGIDAGTAAVVATGLWRLRNKMVDPVTGRARPELRALYRHVESVWDALLRAGIEVQGHDGARFDAGLSLSVVAFQPTAGIERECVIETVRPSVYRSGRLIQQGEVIVGTPAAAGAAGERDTGEPGR
jgi:hypothetical protein